MRLKLAKEIPLPSTTHSENFGEAVGKIYSRLRRTGGVDLQMGG